MPRALCVLKMDRTESYKILSERLMYFSEHESCKKFVGLEQEFEESIIGDSGKNYRLSYKQSGKKLTGKIHDNNNANFQLLEESININT